MSQRRSFDRRGKAPGRSAWLRGRTLLGVLLGLAAVALLAVACGKGHRRDVPPVIVLGFDGMDPELTGKMIAEGKLPNLAKLAHSGGFQRLGTSVPPQSPVAWSNFITGMDSGGHGIFDFIHRDPKTMIPYLSTSHAEESTKFVRINKYQFPLDGGEILLLRHGKPFWEALEDRGVETTIIRMPANFPPSGAASHELSGMGTPDLQGTPGTFSFYTSELFAYYGKKVSGGEVHEVFVEDGKMEDKLYGPSNPFLQKAERATTPFTVLLDPDVDAAKVVVGDEQVLLKKGEWSDWVPVDFKLIPTQHLKGICRFYLQEVRPELKLFVSPINFDPADPALPISHPADYAAELAEATGRYYTQEMPEDTKALKEGVFSPQEFLVQARFVVDDLIQQYEYVLDQYKGGLLFYYFGNTDQVGHMMWRTLDPGHPAYDPAVDGPLATVMPDLYEKFDRIVGYTLDHMPKDALLVVMSDHGFASWRRAFHLNSWLRDNGYLVPLDPSRKEGGEYFSNVDWGKTRAYALGLNGLYVNLKGREKNGIVEPGEKKALLDEIGAKLLEVRDPWDGQVAITKVYQSEEYYRDRGYLDIGPDMQIGYRKTVRGSNESALGALTAEWFSDNTNAWNGDHCMDHEAVPGVLFTSRPLKKTATCLKDLAAAILAEYGIENFPASAAGKR